MTALCPRCRCLRPARLVERGAECGVATLWAYDLAVRAECEERRTDAR